RGLLNTVHLDVLRRHGPNHLLHDRPGRAGAVITWEAAQVSSAGSPQRPPPGTSGDSLRHPERGRVRRGSGRGGEKPHVPRFPLGGRRRRTRTALGDPSASVPTAERVLPRRGFDALSPWAAATSAAFVSR